MEVIGAGWGRTGTSSFKAALEILGYPTYHMKENVQKNHTAFWIDLYDGKQRDFEEVFGATNSTYTASCDFPSATFWEEQLKRYPEAKVILTVRDPEKWYESCVNTILNFTPDNEVCPLGVKVMLWLGIPTKRFGDLNNSLWYRELRGNFSKDNMIEAFCDHVKDVIERCPQDKLLIYEISQGWGPLCTFLDKPIPDVPFPHVNDTKEFQKIVTGTMIAGNVILFLSVGALAGVAGFAYHYLNNKKN